MELSPISNHAPHDKWTAQLADDGSLDTVVTVYDADGELVDTIRWTPEAGTQWRDDTGAITDDGWKELAKLSIESAILFREI